MKRRNNTPIYFHSRAFDIALVTTGIRTSTALAKAAEISRSRMYMIRAGYIPPAEVRARIARLLELKVGDLWRPVQGAR